MCSSIVLCIYSVSSNAVETSISSVGPPVAGYNYTLICTVTLTEGLLGTPTVKWVGRDGHLVVSAEDVIVYDPVTSDRTTNLTLFFDPIRTRDEGVYICKASVSSTALSGALNSSMTYPINVTISKPQNIVGLDAELLHVLNTQITL